MAPASISSHGQSEPLLPPKFMNEQHSEPINPTASTAIKALSIIAIGVGAATLAAPRWTCALFQFPIPAQSAIFVRMFGVRDLILGELLITAEDKKSLDGGKREIRRALWANIGAGAVDLGSVCFAVATGTMGRLPGGLLAGGAAVGMGLGALGLRGL